MSCAREHAWYKKTNLFEELGLILKRRKCHFHSESKRGRKSNMEKNVNLQGSSSKEFLKNHFFLYMVNFLFQLFIWLYFILFAVAGQLAAAQNEVNSTKTGKGYIYFTYNKLVLESQAINLISHLFFAQSKRLFFLQLCQSFKLFGA